ncbi:lamin tail domain-containing protein [Photobacterium lipolyticum]|uniref:LTD domain-containing protein n=1 Tax=Photobacterium lipolyticum TaxID=266810 RepID=A0A2T3N3Y8_9GAMM|nr:lamin tail domain-containing protein [Photobacterium lipolyticum]PSW07163.1 hypothetical protein C9I89_00055 [Photobacterium lipolyticum]
MSELNVDLSYQLTEQLKRLSEQVYHQAQNDISEVTDTLGEYQAQDAWWNAACTLMGQKIVISEIQFDGGDIDAARGEYIELHNTGPLMANLSGWHINAGNEGQDYYFPINSFLEPDGRIRIYTCEGDYSFNSQQPIWNNKGDIGLLFDDDKNLVSSLAYGDYAHEFVDITEIQYDGIKGRGEADEYIQIGNIGDMSIDITNWRINAGKNQDFIFPLATHLLAKQSVRVYTNTFDPLTGGYSFNSKSAIWNNRGDTAMLFDHKGKLAAEFSYEDNTENEVAIDS